MKRNKLAVNTPEQEQLPSCIAENSSKSVETTESSTNSKQLNNLVIQENDSQIPLNILEPICRIEESNCYLLDLFDHQINLMNYNDSGANPNYFPHSAFGDEISLQSVHLAKRKRKNKCLSNNTDLSQAETNEQKTKIKNIRKVMHEKKIHGEEYITRKGVIKKAKIFTPLNTCCRKKCCEKIDIEDQEKLFNDFNKVSARNDQVLADSINLENKKAERKGRSKTGATKNRELTAIYCVCVNSVKQIVCKKMFLNIFSISKSKVDSIIMKKRHSETGLIEQSQRGRHEPHNKRNDENEEIIKHINSFPKYDSCHTSKKFLSPQLNIRKMYELYNEKRIEENAVPLKYVKYVSTFKNLGYKFKYPSNDTCSTCDILKLQIKLAKSSEQKEKLQSEKKCHLDEVDFHR